MKMKKIILLVIFCLLAELGLGVRLYKVSPNDPLQMRPLLSSLLLTKVSNVESDLDKFVILRKWVRGQFNVGASSSFELNPVKMLGTKHKHSVICDSFSRLYYLACKSVGLKARILHLNTEDNQGHYANEVWLGDSKRWIYMDPMYNTGVVVNGRLCSSLEIHQALGTKIEISFSHNKATTLPVPGKDLLSHFYRFQVVNPSYVFLEGKDLLKKAKRVTFLNWVDEDTPHIRQNTEFLFLLAKFVIPLLFLVFLIAFFHPCKLNIILLIFILALLLRLFCVAFQLQGGGLTLAGDSVEYDAIAINLVKGEGFAITSGNPTSMRAPLYPFFLAVIYYIFGHSYVPALIVQAIISSLSCIFIYLIGKRIHSQGLGIIAGLLTAIYPALIRYTGFLLTETLYIFLFSGVILYILKIKESNAFAKWALAGLLLGLGMLTKAEAILFPLFIFIWLVIKHKNRFKESLKKFGALLIGILIILSPWIARNYNVHHSFVAISTRGGLVFWGGNNSKAQGKWVVVAEESSPEYQALSEVEQNKQGFKKGLEFIRRYPTKFAINGVKKIAGLLYPFEPRYNLAFGLLFPVALVGMILFWKKVERNNLLYYIFLHSLAIAIMFYGIPRFRLSILPYLIIFSSFGLIYLLRQYPKRTMALGLLSSILVANILLFIYSGPVRIWLKTTLNY